MSLAALAFHKVKSTENWETRDMDNILMMGNELYGFLQCSSTINDRYLLVSELPQHFECCDEMFVFKPDESLPSLLNLLNIDINYDDFNAYSLFEALQIALGDSDGCFVCFGGNTFLVGKSGDGFFFTFDSHSRSTDGYFHENGKSTRVLHETTLHVCDHIISLALSLGFNNATQCEITGVHCSFDREIINRNKETRFDNTTKDSLPESGVFDIHMSSYESDEDVQYISCDS
jgi:hypothetical protein